jgi:hypothetical protein
MKQEKGLWWLILDINIQVHARLMAVETNGYGRHVQPNHVNLEKREVPEPPNKEGPLS